MDSNVNIEDTFITVTDDGGKKYKATVLDVFQVEGYDENNYVVYTFGESVDEQNDRAYISKMEELPDGQGFNFTEIEDPKEWESVNKAFNESLEMLGGVSK